MRRYKNQYALVSGLLQRTKYGFWANLFAIGAISQSFTEDCGDNISTWNTVYEDWTLKYKTKSKYTLHYKSQKFMRNKT